MGCLADLRFGRIILSNSRHSQRHHDRDARVAENDRTTCHDSPCHRTAGLVVDPEQRYFRRVGAYPP